MTARRLKAIVSKIRYKEGWAVRVDDRGDIEIIAIVPDAFSPNNGRRSF